MAYSISIIFSAGLISFFSPCVLSLVPAYISYLTGRSIDESDKRNISKTVVNSIFFILGFSIIFIILGFSASLIGRFFLTNKTIISKIGGILVLIFGLLMTGLFRINLFRNSFLPKYLIKDSYSPFASFVLGIVFSFGWSPCIGPVLGVLLTAIAVSGMTNLNGAFYLSIYSLGLALPFLTAAFGVGWIKIILKKYKRITAIVQIGAGVTLAISGVLLFFGVFDMVKYLPVFFKG